MTRLVPAYGQHGAEIVSKCVVGLRGPATPVCTIFVPRAFPEMGISDECLGIGVVPISGRVRACSIVEKLSSH